MANGLYDAGLSAIGPENYLTETIRVSLMTSAHSFDRTDDFWANVSSNEVVGTGYTASGIALTSKTVSAQESSNKTFFDASDVSWADTTLSNVRHAVIWRETGDADTSELIGNSDFDENKNTNVSEFKITWQASGIWSKEDITT